MKALQNSHHSEKLSQSICHCEEQSDVAISNFIDQNNPFRILTTIIFTYQSNEHYRSLRRSAPLDDRLQGFVYDKNLLRK